MRHDFLDRYSRIDSVIHRLPASGKLFFVLGLIIVTVTVPPGTILLHLPAIAILLSVAATSRIPPGFLFRRILLLEPFVLGVSLLSLLRPEGLSLFLPLVVKSTISLFAMILLANTTPFSEILDVLRKMHLPAIMVTILALLYRYLFVLIDEAERMTRARQSRTFSAGKLRTWFSAATIIGQLFVRSTERSERIYQAMSARGWR